MAYAPDLTVSAICRLFPCSGRRAPNWLERKLSHLVPSASSRNSLTNKITNAATRSEETEVRRPSAMIAAAGTHCAHRGRVEASPLSSSARPFARGSPLRCFCCWLHCCIPRSVLSLLEHPRRALSYATRILYMASSEASHQSSNDHDAFAMSASMRPTLLTDPLDGRETSMTDGFRFIRRHIEFFPASVADVEDRRKKGGIKSDIRIGQIGIRCVHCSHVAPENRVNGTATFPTNLSLVYQSVRNWQSKSSCRLSAFYHHVLLSTPDQLFCGVSHLTFQPSSGAHPFLLDYGFSPFIHPRKDIISSHAQICQSK